MATSMPFEDIRKQFEVLAREIVRPAADDVDRASRFPEESFAALRKERLMAAAVPADLGGLGCSLSQVSALCQALGQACASTAMVYAMHQIQLACMARHAAAQPFFRRFMSDAAKDQLLIASATSEVGVGGDMRSSIAAVEAHGERFRLAKSSSVLSYGAQADAILVTARRDASAAASDQVLALVRKAEYTLKQTTKWDTLGLRGTCSPGFSLETEAAAEQIIAIPFSEIASVTMVPYAHVSWASCWLGIATDAVARARAFVRADARKRPGVIPFSANRLADATSLLHTMRTAIADSAREWDEATARPDGAEVLSSVGYALRINNLKLTMSKLVADIVLEALRICGMAGYSNSSPFSMGRQLRDSLSAALMVSNDRINATNAGLLLVYKDD